MSLSSTFICNLSCLLFNKQWLKKPPFSPFAITYKASFLIKGRGLVCNK
ncbi:hypothetical protein DB42_EV00140 [Neochlamydia sp. EPS4]|nr:hypothetical protein DB42_EV00140 [Neochlamydia sp. EPS4]